MVGVSITADAHIERKQSEAMIDEKLFEQAEEIDLFRDLTKMEKLWCNIKAWTIILLHRLKETI